ncbi:hypothetical protein BaRGS_00040574 [Batillaria attramentaria]|uniref:Uncharacterized protein n=1 Tax=Batillaria attramentaria TaxID=370345 RepID=A0ABD0IZK4_9CAEN
MQRSRDPNAPISRTAQIRVIEQTPYLSTRPKPQLTRPVLEWPAHVPVNFYTVSGLWPDSRLRPGYR